ncbi:hypothetical protein JST97_28295 [bacterium]|nr:hypothetical protein [bacterium]
MTPQQQLASERLISELSRRFGDVTSRAEVTSHGLTVYLKTSPARFAEVEKSIMDVLTDILLNQGILLILLREA